MKGGFFFLQNQMKKRKRNKTESGKRFDDVVWIHGLDKIFMNLQVLCKEKASGYMAVDVFYIPRCFIRVFDVTEIANQR